MFALPTWLAIYLSIGLSLALLCTASTARLRRTYKPPHGGRPSYAYCIGVVGSFMLLWPLVVAMGVRRRG